MCFLCWMVAIRTRARNLFLPEDVLHLVEDRRPAFRRLGFHIKEGCHSEDALFAAEESWLHCNRAMLNPTCRIVVVFTSHAAYPKMSLTLSKIEDPRSAGLFSTFNVAPSWSTARSRCSSSNEKREETHSQQRCRNPCSRVRRIALAALFISP